MKALLFYICLTTVRVGNMEILLYRQSLCRLSLCILSQQVKSTGQSKTENKIFFNQKSIEIEIHFQTFKNQKALLCPLGSDFR